MMICVGVLLLLAGGMTVATHIVNRTALRTREIATRRVIGARRSDVVRMLLAEGAAVITLGILIGGLVG